MGQTLGEPIKAKETAACGNTSYKVGSSAMQGWRITMEDAHTHLLALPDDNNSAFFAVYDGHGGAKVSEYASLHLHKSIVNNQFYKENRIPEAIQHGFLELDEQMMIDEDIKEEMSGTTAITILIKDNIAYCGNVGDSRAVACINGVAFPMSYDHKPANEMEQKRIEEAGGWVEFNRVNGNLALSRALGDFAFKRNGTKLPKDQVVTSYPDVSSLKITKDVEFMVIACDGIWDVMTNAEVVDFCRTRLQKKMDPEAICEELLDACLSPDCEVSGLGCDNMSVVLILCLQGDTMEEYYSRVSRAVGPKNEVQNPIKMCTEVAPTDETFATPKESPDATEDEDETKSEDEKPPMVFTMEAKHEVDPPEESQEEAEQT